VLQVALCAKLSVMVRKTVFGTSILGLAAGLLAGCSGSDKSQCDDYAPCGGNPTGTWIVQENCLTEAVIPVDICPGAEAEISDLNYEGTVTVSGQSPTDPTGAAGAYDINATFSGSAKVTFAQTCIATVAEQQGAGGLGALLSCAALGPFLDTALSQSDLFPAGSIARPQCSGDTTCTCRFDVVNVPAAGTGTYTTSGNALVLSDNPLGDGATTYCVQGDEMQLRVDSTDAALPSTTLILSRE